MSIYDEIARYVPFNEQEARDKAVILRRRPGTRP